MHEWIEDFLDWCWDNVELILFFIILGVILIFVIGIIKQGRIPPYEKCYAFCGGKNLSTYQEFDKCVDWCRDGCKEAEKE